jgi:2-methylcitrate dehydratase PrpD
LTLHLARWVKFQAGTELPIDVRHHTRRLILDHLGGVVASSVREVGAVLASHVSRMYGAGTVTGIGLGGTTALGAALLNGTNGHGIETDDGYTPGSFHPTSVVLPAVFAVAEERGSSSDQVLRAAAIGMEVGCRLAHAGHPATRRNHFHNTPIAGVFAAAVAAAVLLELDEEQIANALGIAGSHASGLFEFLGQSAEVKRLHAGKAARDGIASAALAQSGLTGPTSILEGKEGYFAAYAGEEGKDWFQGPVIDRLGEEWVVLRSYIKPYPCCRHLHGPIDAALAMRSEHRFAADHIDKVRVGTFAIAAGHNGTTVDTMMGAQLSIPYTLAVALRTGDVTLGDFSPEARQDPASLALMNKVTVELDAAAESAYPLQGRPAEVTITLTDGTSHTQRVEHPYGESANPVTDADLETKVRNLVEPVIGAGGADRLIQAVWEFRDLGFLAEIDALVRSTNQPPADVGGGSAERPLARIHRITP